MIKNICVFCGSSKGKGNLYLEGAEKLANALIKNKINLVYGGAHVGLMGRLAKTILDNGGKVIGVMPKNLVDREVAYREITELKIVSTMHERKAMMENLADAFIAMPGGFGTIEEIFEMITWSQLQLHSKPCGFLNINGFYDKLLDFIDHTIGENFINMQYKQLFATSSNPDELLEKLLTYKPISIDKAALAKANL